MSVGVTSYRICTTPNLERILIYTSVVDTKFARPATSLPSSTYQHFEYLSNHTAAEIRDSTVLSLFDLVTNMAFKLSRCHSEWFIFCSTHLAEVGSHFLQVP